MTDKGLIVIKDLDKSYALAGQTTQILKKISFTIQAGELVAIIGASGSGKSTLMNIMGLLDIWDSGDYFLAQHPVKALSQDELALLRNNHIGFVFQQFNLLSRFTAKQNVALPLLYRQQLSKQEIEKRVIKALSRVGMAAFSHHKPNQLSGGQQQRVAIARAIVGEPEVILADEPTGALDSQTGDEVLSLFISLNQEGRTIIMVTHDARVASQCRRQIKLTDGQIVTDHVRIEDSPFVKDQLAEKSL